MTDRLLTYQEIRKVQGSRLFDCPINEITEAQDLKTAAAVNAEWVEWIGDEIIEFALNFNQSVSFKETLLRVWQERKRSVGL